MANSEIKTSSVGIVGGEDQGGISKDIKTYIDQKIKTQSKKIKTVNKYLWVVVIVLLVSLAGIVIDVLLARVWDKESEPVYNININIDPEMINSLLNK